MAIATQLTMECVTWMNSTLNGPMDTMSFGLAGFRSGSIDLVFLKAAFHQRKRKRRAINRHIEFFQEERDRADMVFMPVRQQQSAHVLAVFFEESQIGRDNIDAQKFVFREHHPGVDHDDVVAVANRHHVHPELTESAERDDLQFFILHSFL